MKTIRNVRKYPEPITVGNLFGKLPPSSGMRAATGSVVLLLLVGVGSATAGGASVPAIDLGTLVGYPTSTAIFVDDRVVAGTASPPSGSSFHGIAWPHGTAASIRDLGTLPTNTENPYGGNWSQSLGLSRGVIVGSGDGGLLGTPRALVYDLFKDTKWRDIGTLGGAIAVPTDIDDGLISGWSQDSNYKTLAFAYDLKSHAPTMIPLDDGSGYTRATAAGGGFVVGWGLGVGRNGWNRLLREDGPTSTG